MPDWALIVDDDRDNRELLAEFLESMGHVVMACDSAGAAQKILDRRGRPGVVVSDVRLPDVQGPAFVESMRGRPGFADTPVIYVTGMPLGLEGQPGHHVLVKPFDLDVLVRLVSRYCGAPPSHPAAATV